MTAKATKRKGYYGKMTSKKPPQKRYNLLQYDEKKYQSIQLTMVLKLRIFFLKICISKSSVDLGILYVVLE